MQDGIFRNGLKNDLRDTVSQGFLRDIPMDLEDIAVPGQLEPDIGLDMQQLIPHRNQLPPPAQADPQEIRQILHHLRQLIHLLVHCIPINGIQCVIKQMRRHLGMQSQQLHFLMLQIHHVALLHKPVDPLHHLVEGGVQLPDLIPALRRAAAGKAHTRLILPGHPRQPA
ncbi:hypothetical protein D3C75_668340 [compost metagenome]